MSYTYHGTTDLIALPERGVQTFPSGLVRIDRTYVCRKESAPRYRVELAEGNPLPLDDGAPAIDGVYIFPAPVEATRDDGFVEFRVSAYGRTNTTGSTRVVFDSGAQSGINYTISSLISEVCYPTTTAVSQITLAPNFTPEIAYRYSSQETSRIIELSKNVSYVQIGDAIRVIGFPFGGFITETPFGNNPSLYSYGIYKIDLRLQLIGSSSKGFGYFSEFTSSYASTNPVVKIFAAASNRNGVFIDGIPLSSF